MANKMTFKRGDTVVHNFVLPKNLYELGGSLHFMAKSEPDDDFEDGKAEISKTFNLSDAAIEEEKAVLSLKFSPSDTKNVKFNGEDVRELNGEFELRTLTGDVYSLPNNNKYIKVLVYADIRRGGS